MDTIEKALQKFDQAPGVPGADRNSPPPDGATALSSRSRAEINFDQLRAEGLLVPDDTRTQLKEEFRHIKRPLLKKLAANSANGRTQHRNIVMVTSARPGEGKTYNAINLALSVAEERNRRVLLIDADVLKPSVGRKLGLEETRGLVDYLTGEAQGLRDLLLKTNIPQFTVMQSGKRHHLTTELLASDRMRQLIDELAQRYSDRVVVFDCPPLLSTTEASVLVQLAGQVVMVVAEGETTHSEVNKSLALIGSKTDVGVVLNKSRVGHDGYGYYYYGS
ncbi:MAG: XrtA-associated tyrosine autokinase [Pseudomonadota bacterium]|nr:XrtA-associated tyrosine autokinase [Pseudomonadota bacterium]